MVVAIDRLQFAQLVGLRGVELLVVVEVKAVIEFARRRRKQRSKGRNECARHDAIDTSNGIPADVSPVGEFLEQWNSRRQFVVLVVLIVVGKNHRGLLLLVAPSAWPSLAAGTESADDSPLGTSALEVRLSLSSRSAFTDAHMATSSSFMISP